MNEKQLLKYAIDYLSKYDSSKKNLLDVLKIKIFRLKVIGIEKNKLLNTIEKIILNLEEKNLLDDKRYSLTKISSLSRAGRSQKYIFNYLIKKGINIIQIKDSFEIFKESNNNWELNSAKIFAKKKKLIDSNDSYEKKLAKMARAGFSYDMCKKILG